MNLQPRHIQSPISLCSKLICEIFDELPFGVYELLYSHMPGDRSVENRSPLRHMFWPVQSEHGFLKSLSGDHMARTYFT